MERKALANRLLFAGVAGLVILGVGTPWFGPHSISRIERKVADAATHALTDGGYAWARATAYGQKVVLEGVAPSEKARESAVAAVDAAGGVVKVAATALEVAHPVSPFALRARKNGTAVVIEGVAPTRESMRKIDETAKALFRGKVTEKVQLASGAPKGVDWSIAAIQGLEALSHLSQGSFALVNDGLVVEGVAPNEAAADDITDKLSRAGGGIKTSVRVEGPAEWGARVRNGRISFSGKVGSAAAKRALVTAARLPADHVEDATRIAAVGDWQKQATTALPHLAKFSQGEVTIQDKTFRVSGKATGSVLAYLREDMDKVRGGYPVTYDVVEVAPALDGIKGIDLGAAKGRRAACEAAFDQVSAENRIVFVPRTARLTRASGEALDKLVELSRRCAEFGVQAQGHTDSTGKRAANLRLSRKRAEAVAEYLEQRGIPATRLSAVGYGPDRPVASNRTAQGQAANRRIEFRVTGGEKG